MRTAVAVGNGRSGAWMLALGLATIAPMGLAYQPAAPAPLVAEGSVEVLFTPWNDAETAVVRALEAARTDVMVQSYTFTSRRLAVALERAMFRGVRVQVLADRANALSGASTQIPWLASRGIPVFLEGDFAAAHNKVMVIDPLLASGAVITGSFNWTHAAQKRNAENLLILRGNRALTERYHQNWLRHRAQAQALQPGQIKVH